MARAAGPSFSEQSCLFGSANERFIRSGGEIKDAYARIVR